MDAEFWSLYRLMLKCRLVEEAVMRLWNEGSLYESVSKTGRLLVVDEDYRNFGLSGELAAVDLESGNEPAYARVCTEESIPYSRERENQTLPNTDRIIKAGMQLMERRKEDRDVR